MNNLLTFFVWSSDYYDSPSQMFPRDDQKHGRFTAIDEAHLKEQLKNKGLIVDQCRWEAID